MTDVQVLSSAAEVDSAGQKHPSTSTITVRRRTLFGALCVLILLVGAYLAGWIVGASSGERAAAVQGALREAAEAIVVGASGSNVIVEGSQVLSTTGSRQHFDVTIDNHPVIGPENAPVTLIEFGDYQCDFCKQFHDETLPALLRQYDGKIRFTFRDYPIRSIHVGAQSAAEASRCAADQGKYWAYQDLLFRDTWRLAEADLLANAEKANLDTAVFQRCLESGQHTEDVRRDYQAGLALGVSGTPTFFVNGRMLIGAQPLGTFKALIDAELAASSLRSR